MKLLLADDHALFRDALLLYMLRNCPETDVLPVGSMDEVYMTLKAHGDIDLILLDFQMPGAGRVAVISDLCRKNPQIPVVLMSGVVEQDEARPILDAGVAAFFPKTMSGTALIQALEKIMAGERFVPIDPATNRMFPSYYGPADKAGMKWLSDHLTRREKDVLDCLMEGLSNKDIAQAMGIKPVTVKLHIRSLCRKLGAKNRTQAALKAMRMGYEEKAGETRQLAGGRRAERY